MTVTWQEFREEASDPEGGGPADQHLVLRDDGPIGSTADHVIFSFYRRHVAPLYQPK